MTDAAAIELWPQFLKEHPQAHLLQTPEWGQLKDRFGWDYETVVAGQAGALVLYRTLPLGLKLAYIPKGPVGTWLPDLLPELDRNCREMGAFALKLEPDEPWDRELASELADQGFIASVHAIQPARTLVIDLNESADEILARMHQKTRYNIRLSERKGVKVREWRNIDSFGLMMLSTGERQEFGVHNPAYYKEAYDLFHPQGMAECFVAEYAGEALAALMVFARGQRAWYFYGASTPKERSRMPTYALQWQAIQWAKQRGCQQYDLWGIPDRAEEILEKQFTERSDGLWGVYRFKRGFGGRIHRSAGAWDRVYRSSLYSLYRLAARWLL